MFWGSLSLWWMKGAKVGIVMDLFGKTFIVAAGNCNRLGSMTGH